MSINLDFSVLEIVFGIVFLMAFAASIYFSIAAGRELRDRHDN
jgi:Ca2+/Na+ antiporter